MPDARAMDRAAFEKIALFKYVKGIDKREALGFLRRFQQGDVAQLVRACGSYPQCPGFKSLHRHHLKKNKSPSA
jgi:hypothetical protein